MRPWGAITGLILLWTDAVVSHIQMSGVVGQPVTIQCIYSIAGGVTAMCWGRGPCSLYSCSNQLIKTDGHRVVFQKSKRYQLNGPISKGNVSLTIKNVTQADSGTYCCRVESSGWFKDLKINILLEIKPAPPKVTSVPTSHQVSTSAPTTPASTQNLKTGQQCSNITSGVYLCSYNASIHTKPQDSAIPICSTKRKSNGNGTVAEPSDGVWEYNETHMCLEEKECMTTNEAFYIGISIPIVLLLAILAAIITKKYLCARRKVLQIQKLSSIDPRTGTLQNPAVVHYRAHENI
ncbi:hypothetical protein mRhiFer1_006215 [Rhinolophus ferrumequinum]|uniref:Ig-like domain-containing protein n=1 Tax=Rhinolophus ferrumequinum TaxID=59479 RepID=A0A7J7RXA5_RHIFE|nr:hypothetical protein mRhiFer1_006215 [Rhinolophus ferrumequinum]